MSKYALPCIACGRELQNVDADSSTNQPYNGTAFTSHGHYGSTIYDPMDGHYIELNICDACLALHPERVIEGRDSRPVMEDGVVVGFEKVEGYRPVRWWPSRREIDYALEVTRKESGIDPPAPDEEADA